jgi:hypothetical protein
MPDIWPASQPNINAVHLNPGFSELVGRHLLLSSRIMLLHNLDLIEQIGMAV